LQHLHAAHGAADHRQQFFNAQMIDQAFLRPDHVADGDQGEAQAKGFAGGRDPLGRAGRTHAAADNIAQITKEASVSIGLAWPIMVVHQPGLPVMGWSDRDITGRRSGAVTDQHRIAFGGIQAAISHIGDGGKGGKFAAAIQLADTNVTAMPTSAEGAVTGRRKRGASVILNLKDRS